MNKLDSFPCYWIGRRLRWAGIQVTDMKEKFGTWRVYCSFGIWDFHQLTHNGYSYIQYKGIWKWLYYKTDILQNRMFNVLINWWLVPLQRRWYRRVYRQALLRFPEERDAILYGADCPELIHWPKKTK